MLLVEVAHGTPGLVQDPKLKRLLLTSLERLRFDIQCVSRHRDRQSARRSMHRKVFPAVAAVLHLVHMVTSTSLSLPLPLRYTPVGYQSIVYWHLLSRGEILRTHQTQQGS